MLSSEEISEIADVRLNPYQSSLLPSQVNLYLPKSQVANTTRLFAYPDNMVKLARCVWDEAAARCVTHEANSD